MKKLFLRFTGLILIFGMLLTGFVYADAGVSVYVDDTSIEFDVQPQLIGGRTMVPLRAIFESLGAVVEWDDATRTVTAYNEAYLVKTTINNNIMTVNGKEKVMDIAPMLVNGRTLAPARFVAEAFNCDVYWNGDIKRVDIYTKEINYNDLEQGTQRPDKDNNGTVEDKNDSIEQETQRPDKDNNGTVEDKSDSIEQETQQPDTEDNNTADTGNESRNDAMFVVGVSEAYNPDGVLKVYVRVLSNGDTVIYELDAGKIPAVGTLVVPEYKDNGDVKKFILIDSDYENGTAGTSNYAKGYTGVAVGIDSSNNSIAVDVEGKETTFEIPESANIYVMNNRSTDRIKYKTDAYIGYVEYNEDDEYWYINSNDKFESVEVTIYEYNGEIVYVLFTIN